MGDSREKDMVDSSGNTVDIVDSSGAVYKLTVGVGVGGLRGSRSSYR